MPFEDDFTRALRDAAELAPDTGPTVLTAGAERHGQRLRRRRRGQVAGVVVAVLTVAVLGAVLLSPQGPAVLGPAHGRPPAPSVVTGRQVLDLFTTRLPPGTVSEAGGYGPGELASGAGASAHLFFDDGRGASMMVLNLDRVADGPEANRCRDPFEEPTESCDRTVRPDGSVLVIDKLEARQAGGPENWIAVLVTPDGRRVRLDEYNATSAGPPLTRAEPPLTADQLTSLVTGGWDAVFTAVPEAVAPTGGPTSPPPSTGEILATVAPLLPAVATGTAGGGQDGTGAAHLSVAFEGRTSMLEVRVDPASQVNRDAKRNVDQVAGAGATERLPDGSSVVVTQTGATKSGGGPTVSRSVEVFHPDGLRITVSEWNGANGYEFEAGTPALTVEQLRAVATSAAWRS